MKLDNEKILILIAEKEMFIKDFCKSVGIDEPAFKAMREGRRSPRPATIGRIAKALGVDVKDIIQDGDSNDRMER